MFNPNWDILIKQCLHPDFRWDERIDWIRSLIKPLKSMYDDFNTFRKRQNYLLSFSFQRGSMEKLLNEEYPNQYNGIFIEDYNWKNPVYIFNHSENQVKTYTYNNSENQSPLHIRNHVEFGGGAYEYIIWFPSSVNYVEAQVRALVDRYNHAPKRYLIQTY